MFGALAAEAASWSGATGSATTVRVSSRSSSGLRSSSSSTKAATSRLLDCSSLIACRSCGVITSDCDCRRSRRGAMLTRGTPAVERRYAMHEGLMWRLRAWRLETEPFAEIDPAHALMRDDVARRTLHQHLPVMQDIGPVDDLQRLAHVVVGDQHADAAVLQVL